MEKYGVDPATMLPTQEQLDRIKELWDGRDEPMPTPRTFEEAQMMIDSLEV